MDVDSDEHRQLVSIVHGTNFHAGADVAPDEEVVPGSLIFLMSVSDLGYKRT
jgi:hypothetical protein